MNSMSVHTDCVEDVDTLLADICFNEDLYAKPPTVEFTVTDYNAQAEDMTTAKLRRASTSNIPSSSSSANSNNNSNSSDNNNSSSNSSGGSSIGTFGRDSSALLSSSSSGSSSSGSNSNSGNSNSNSGNSNSNSGNSNSNSVISRSEILATATTPNTRLRKIRTPMTEPAPKSIYSSVKEIPVDLEEDKEITVYISGRNRVVYYGINGSPYYITDSGKRITAEERKRGRARLKERDKITRKGTYPYLIVLTPT